MSSASVFPFPEPESCLIDLRIGRAQPLGSGGVISGIRKHSAVGRVNAAPMGLHGDQQADQHHHGGVEKAIHHYAAEHYGYWRARFPSQLDAFRTGAFGENFSTLGLTEYNVCVGDIFRVGGVTLQISQARQPCWKLNVAFGISGMARTVQESLRTGWYYRVLEPGDIGTGDIIELLERPQPQWPLIRLLRAFYQTPLNLAELSMIAELPSLSESWRMLAVDRLSCKRMEDWTRRLETPASAR